MLWSGGVTQGLLRVEGGDILGGLTFDLGEVGGCKLGFVCGCIGPEGWPS